MKAKWMVIVFGPALLMLIGSILVMLFLPHPVPRNATGGQRVYLTYCASCHGANGHGSWRAWIFFLRPGDLGDARLVDVHVRRLRMKVEDDPHNPTIIQTVRGMGYKVAEE